MKNDARVAQGGVKPESDGNDKAKRRRSSWAFEPIPNSDQSSSGYVGQPIIGDIASGKPNSNG